MMTFFSSSLSVLFVLFAVSKTFAMTSCPDTVKVEAGTTSTISCIVDETTNDFYWYKGKASDSDLVGKLENEIKTISEQHMDDYDMSPSGALLILKAGIMHESLYSLVTFDSNGTPEEDKVIVNITISPDPSCPIINNCTPCEKCELLQTNSSGTLTCKVVGSRPRVRLGWITTSQTGVSFLKYPPKYKLGNVSLDTWDTSVSLHYEFIGLCADTIVLQCVAEDDLDVLQSRASTIDIRAAHCNAATSANFPPDGTKKSSEKFPIVLVIIVVISVVLLVVLVVLCVIFTIRQAKQRGYIGIPLTSLPENKLDAQLVSSLKDRYQKFCYLTPLQWVQHIHIAHLFTEGWCTVTYKEKEKRHYTEIIEKMSTKDLRTKSDILSKRWVLFKAEQGYGRTTFLKQFVQEWIKDKENNRLLIYIPLKESTVYDKISEIVIGDNAEASKFEVEDIETTLNTTNCLVVLDGLEDLDGLKDLRASSSKEDVDKSDVSDEGVSGNHVTIEQLLKRKGSCNYAQLHVWVSSREAECDIISCRDEYVEVEMTGFSDRQFELYVEKCCSFYVKYKCTVDKKLFTKQLSKMSNSKKTVSCNETETTEKCNEAQSKVKDFLKENNISTIFQETPLLVNLIVHILAAKYTSAVEQLNKPINDMNTLMREVINSMEARYRYKKSLSDEYSFSNLEKQLGEIALEHNKQLTKRDYTFWEKEIRKKNLDEALGIGLLKYSKDSSCVAKERDVEFYHQHIQEYLADHVYTY